MSQRTILCISSYFKGNKFLETAKKEGARVILVVRESVYHEPWAREYVDEMFAVPSLFDRRAVINSITYLARTRQIDRIVGLDDYDIEMAATLREHMRVPGMGETTAHYFRDKLAMRERAWNRELPVPRFVQVLNDDRIREFLAETPAPWLIKPRSAANAFGIVKFERAEDVWRKIDELGDDRSNYLLERYLPGDVCHVDAVVSNGQAVFAEAHRYRRPLMNVAKEGGVFATRTLPRGGAEAKEMIELHQRVVAAFGLRHGVTHMEFIRAREDGKLYFLETAARVGGAHIYDVVEASTGVNLWAEWAKIELSQGETPYAPPAHRKDYAGILMALSRYERPDTTPFQVPELKKTIDMKNHIGVVFGSPRQERIEELLEQFEPVVARDYVAVLPEAPPTH